jgi:excisionase family DNA binding protein
MDLHNILYSADPSELKNVQLVVNAADLRQCFDEQEKWIRSVIKEASEPEYYTREELSQLLHISLPTIDRRVESGKLPKPIKHGRRVLFDKSSVNCYIKENK